MFSTVIRPPCLSFACGLIAAVSLHASALAEGVDRQVDLPENLYFDVVIDGRDMGYHHVEFSRDGDDLVAAVEIDLRYEVAFITLFKYIHRNIERWQGTTLMALSSNTDDDGDKYYVLAERQGESLAVDGALGMYMYDDPIATTSYWNYESMTANGNMLNSQKGDVLPYTLERQGEEQVMVRGEMVVANKYHVNAEIDTYIWYAQETHEWVKLEFDVRGRTISYRLVGDKSESDQASVNAEGS